MEQTSRHHLPYIMPSQAQKHVTHNEALQAIDALLWPSALSRALTSPPADPSEADAYIVATPATGFWDGHDKELAVFQDGAWTFLSPVEGMLVHVADEGMHAMWRAGGWEIAGRGGPFLQSFTVNAEPTPDNRLLVKGERTLFDHDGEGHQLRINKAAATDTASIIFQTGYSGRAEIGTAGSDSLSIKVSADGAGWTTALVVDASGQVGIGGAPMHALDIAGNVMRVKAGSFAAVALAATGPGGREYRFGATDDNNGLGGGRFVLYDQTGSAVCFIVTPDVFETHVPLRLRHSGVANLPVASVAGAGALVFVPDASGGGVPAYCDGTSWRRVTDGTFVD